MSLSLFDPEALAALIEQSNEKLAEAVDDLEKVAFIPPSGGGGQPQPGMDPAAAAAGGQAQPGMDPAAMMGGQPPPADPAAGQAVAPPAPPTVMDPTGGAAAMQQPQPQQPVKKKFEPELLHAEVYQLKQLVLALLQHTGAPIPGKALMTNAPDPAMSQQAEAQFQQQDQQAEAAASGVPGGMPPIDPGMAKAGEDVSRIGHPVAKSEDLEQLLDENWSKLLAEAIGENNRQKKAEAAEREYNESMTLLADIASRNQETQQAESETRQFADWLRGHI